MVDFLKRTQHDHPSIARASALFSEKPLLGRLRLLCRCLSEKDRELFAADCAQRGRSSVFFPEEQKDAFQTLIETRRQRAKGQASEEQWKAAQEEALRLSREVMPIPKKNPFASLSKYEPLQRDIETGVSFAARAIAADPFDAARYAALAKSLYSSKLHPFEYEIEQHTERAEQYLRGVDIQAADRARSLQAAKNVLAMLEQSRTQRQEKEDQKLRQELLDDPEDDEDEWELQPGDEEDEEQEKEEELEDDPTPPERPQENPKRSALPNEDSVTEIDRVLTMLHGVCSALEEQDQLRFLADLTERQLHLFEAQFPQEKRPRQAIASLRLWAERKISEKEWDNANQAIEEAAQELFPEWEQHARDTEGQDPFQLAPETQESMKRGFLMGLASLPHITLLEATRFVPTALFYLTGSEDICASETRWMCERAQQYLSGEASITRTQAFTESVLDLLCELNPKEGDKKAQELLRWAERIQANSERLAPREQQHLTADVLERLLPLFEEHYPEVTDPREMIRVRRCFADGQLPQEEWRRAADLALESAERIPPKTALETGKNNPQDAIVGIASLVALSPATILLFAAGNLLLATEDTQKYEEELRWQWSRLELYLQVGSQP